MGAGQSAQPAQPGTVPGAAPGAVPGTAGGVAGAPQGALGQPRIQLPLLTADNNDRLVYRDARGVVTPILGPRQLGPNAQELQLPVISPNELKTQFNTGQSIPVYVRHSQLGVSRLVGIRTDNVLAVQKIDPTTGNTDEVFRAVPPSLVARMNLVIERINYFPDQVPATVQCDGRGKPIPDVVMLRANGERFGFTWDAINKARIDPNKTEASRDIEAAVLAFNQDYPQRIPSTSEPLTGVPSDYRKYAGKTLQCGAQRGARSGAVNVNVTSQTAAFPRPGTINSELGADGEVARIASMLE